MPGTESNIKVVILARVPVGHLVELAGQEGDVPAEGGGHDGHHADQAGPAHQEGAHTAQLRAMIRRHYKLSSNCQHHACYYQPNVLWALTGSCRDHSVHAPLAPGLRLSRLWSVRHHGADLHARHQDEEHDEVKVVVLRHTVAHPGAVVIKGGHALVTHGAVLGPQGLSHQTSPAKLGGLQLVLDVTNLQVVFLCLAFIYNLLCTFKDVYDC